MENSVYFPVFWLVLGVLTAAILAILAILSFYRRHIGKDPELHARYFRQIQVLKPMQALIWILLSGLLISASLAWYWDKEAKGRTIAETRLKLMPVFDKSKVWNAPDLYLAESDQKAALIAYGRDLIARTQDYFGAHGLVKPNSINGMNCQNCHLEAGSKPFGNNYFAVQSTYPQMRARSGALETISKRINDCFQRSLNGAPLDTNSREMRAIQTYMAWLGSGVPKGEKPKGAGLLDLAFLERPADPVKGRNVYLAQCASCHGEDGKGLPMPDSPRNYPPLWGDKSYNQGAGLFRLSRFAGYVKANMPFGISYEKPQLSDEEAWDVAAFVNSQARPAHPFLGTDWPNIEKKPFDHPFAPFADTFPELQHKLGPFAPIVAFYKARQKKN